MKLIKIILALLAIASCGIVFPADAFARSTISAVAPPGAQEETAAHLRPRLAGVCRAHIY
jgi:hypothetical protein